MFKNCFLIYSFLHKSANMFHKRNPVIYPTKVERIFVKSTKSSNDCLACILRPILLINAFVGVSPINCTCCHINKKIKAISFFWTKSFVFVSMMQLTFIISMIIEKISYVSGNIENFSKIEIILLLNMIFQGFLSAVYIICGQCLTSTHIKELKGLSEILSNSKQYDINEFFDKKSKLKYRRQGIYYGTLMFSVGLIHFVYIWYKIDVFNIWTIIYEIKSSVCFNMQILVTLYMSLRLNIYAYLLSVTYKEMQNVLTNCLPTLLVQTTKWTQGVIISKKNYYPLMEKLQKLQRMHCALIVNLNQFNKSCNPTLLICCTGTCCMLVVNYYLQITMWLAEQQNLTYEYVIIKTFMVVAACIHVLSVQNNLLKTVSIFMFIIDIKFKDFLNIFFVILVRI